jgi:hypothetical protein
MLLWEKEKNSFTHKSYFENECLAKKNNSLQQLMKLLWAVLDKPYIYVEHNSYMYNFSKFGISLQ